jgi:hypothetical protein
MKRSHLSKVTPSSCLIALLLVAGVASAQPEGDLPPLEPEPAPPPTAQPSPQPEGTWKAGQALPAEQPSPPPDVRPPPQVMAIRPVPLQPRWRSAQQEPEPQAVPAPKAFFQVQTSLRGNYVTDGTFGIFSDDKWFAQGGLAVSRTVVAAGGVSFAPGLVWETGGIDSDVAVRGQKTRLWTHRLSLRLEGRWHALPWMYGFVRVAPGALQRSLEVDESSAPAPLTQSTWTPSADLGAGAAFLIGPHAASENHVRFWGEIDGGYGWSGRKAIVLSPDLGADDVRRTGALELGELSLRGPFVRLAVTLTF